MIKRFSRRLSWLGALGAVVTGLAIAPTQPAMADVCGSPGCGGVVRNAATRDFDVANCWSGSAVTYVGATPPCVTAFSQNLYHAAWFLSPGQTSTNLGLHYYDVDAYQAPAGCVTRGQQSGSTFSYDRRGKDAYWVKITSATKDVVITSIAC
nr:hypothetical protein [uncultured Actinoplanes sp.]